MLDGLVLRAAAELLRPPKRCPSSCLEDSASECSEDYPQVLILLRDSLCFPGFLIFSQKIHLFANIKNVLKAIISTFFLRTKIR